MDTEIQLSENPLDDYQHTIFSKLKNEDNQIPSQWPFIVSETSYKTQLVHKIRTIPILGRTIFNLSKIDKTIQKPSIEENKDVLYCKEYGFPNIELEYAEPNVKKSSIDHLFSNREDITQSHMNGVKEKESDLLSQNTEPHPPMPALTPTYLLNGKAIPTNLPTKDSHNSTDSKFGRLNPQDNPKISVPKIKRRGRRPKQVDVADESRMLTSGGTVMWSEENDFVYMTGIWKLYQEVMNGLISIDRKNNKDNEHIKHLCLEEWNIIVTNIFGRQNVLPKTSESSSRPNSSGTDASTKDELENDVKRNEGKTIKLKQSIKQFDFKWERVNSHIRKQLLVYYRKYLIHVKNVNPAVLEQISWFQFAQKVRGGFTHIQGTWLPIPLARRLCLMFAYPIRYLLTPVFGSKFPKECENWFKFYEIHSKQNIAFVIPFDNNFIEESNKQAIHSGGYNVDLNNNVKDSMYPQLASDFGNSNSNNYFSYRDTQYGNMVTNISMPEQKRLTQISGHTGSLVSPERKERHNDNNNFQPGKKSFKIEKSDYQNNTNLKKPPGINNIGILKRKPQSPTFDGRNDTRSEIASTSINNPQLVNSQNGNNFFMPLQYVPTPSITPSNASVNIGNIPERRILPQVFIVGERNMVPLDTQSMNNNVQFLNSQAFQYAQTPYQQVAYGTQLPSVNQQYGPIFINTEPVGGLPSRTITSNNSGNQLPLLVPQYRYNSDVRLLIPGQPNGLQVSGTQINSNMANVTVLPPYSSVILNDTVMNPSINTQSTNVTVPYPNMTHYTRTNDMRPGREVANDADGKTAAVKIKHSH